MSFSIFLNSLDGTRLNGLVNEVQYNFNFGNTPSHTGAYKVYMTFASEQQLYSGNFLNFGLVNIDLGVSDSFSTVQNLTAISNNQIFGIIRTSEPHIHATSQVPQVISTSTSNIPANSGAVAYTMTTTTTSPTYNISYLANQTVDAVFGDNAPFFLKSKPRNNQFIVTLTFSNGTLYNVLTVDYGLVLTFEAI